VDHPAELGPRFPLQVLNFCRLCLGALLPTNSMLACTIRKDCGKGPHIGLSGCRPDGGRVL